MDTGDVEVTSAEIARIAGVKPTAVSNWRRRYDSFPAPVGGTDRSPRFDLAQVESWLAAHGREPNIDPEQRLWQALESVRSSLPAADALGRVGTVLLHLHRNPGLLEKDADTGELLRTATEEFAALQARTGLETHDDGGSPPEVPLSVLVDAAVQAARHKSPSSVFERLVARLDQRFPSGSHTVPTALADLVARLAGPGSTVADPACGRGEFLAAAARAGAARLYGQDREASAVRLAALRLAFAGALDGEARLRAADALRSPAFPEAQADAVVCAPPFGERNWGAEELAEDPRWTYGVPPRLESDLAWVQHCLSLAHPSGRVVVLLPPGAAQRPSGRRIRREMVRAGLFRAIVSLPPGFAAHYAVPLQLWVLGHPEHAGGGGPVLVVDTAEEPPDAVADTAGRLWEEFCASPEGFAERPGTARTVDLVDLLDEDVDLTPRVHLPLPRTSAGDVELFTRRRNRWEEALGSLRSLLPEVPEPGPVHTDEVVTLGELAKAGTVTIRRPSSRRADEEAGQRTRARVITGKDVVAGAAASHEEEVDADPMRNPPVQEGDVLVPVYAPRPVARVASAQDAGAYPGAGVYVVRTNPAAVDPWFLAGFVTSGAESRTAVRVGSTGSLRIDPSRMRLPVLPLREQRRFGEMFRRVALFREALREVAELGDALADQASDMVAERWDARAPRT
ncbi:N-6 DNA methylase [Nocardiopsis algeriensis]|uniref:N-6 DNA methylase n=1 Tax=Nocardiopsis algeriensis TaxID=1478215 RepID=UPI003B42A8F4